jgi:hypothetical protein
MRWEMIAFCGGLLAIIKEYGMWKHWLLVLCGVGLLVSMSSCANDKKGKGAANDNADLNGTDDGDTATTSDGAANGDSDGGDKKGDKKDSSNDGEFPDASDDKCADIAWDVETKPINLMVLLDRSLSMQNYKIGDATYAEVVRDAIEKIVSDHAEAGLIDFGLAVFPSPECPAIVDGKPDGLTLAEQCSPADENYGQPMVPFGTPDVYDAFVDVLGTVGQCGGTPICDSLEWLNAYLAELDTSNDTYVLLATDGAPNCAFGDGVPHGCRNTTTDPLADKTQCLDDLCSYNAAAKLASAGFKTFVIGVGEEVKDYVDVMDAIAYYGAGGLESLANIPTPTATNNWYYPADNADELGDALVKITNSAISCEYTVEWNTVPDVVPETGQDVVKSCSDINVKGIPVDADAGLVPLSYMADCSAEEDGQFGWYWAQMEGQTFEEVKKNKRDLDTCTTLRLCPKACDMVKVVDGARQWQSVTAQFGCATIVIIIN